MGDRQPRSDDRRAQVLHPWDVRVRVGETGGRAVKHRGRPEPHAGDLPAGRRRGILRRFEVGVVCGGRRWFGAPVRGERGQRGGHSEAEPKRGESHPLRPRVRSSRDLFDTAATLYASHACRTRGEPAPPRSAFFGSPLFSDATPRRARLRDRHPRPLRPFLPHRVRRRRRPPRPLNRATRRVSPRT